MVHTKAEVDYTVETTQHITGKSLPAIIQDIDLQRCLLKAHSAIRDHSHPTHQLLSLFPFPGCSRTVPTTRPSDSNSNT